MFGLHREEREDLVPQDPSVKKETKEEMVLMVCQEDLDPLEKMDSLVTMVNQDCKGQLDYLG